MPNNINEEVNESLDRTMARYLIRILQLNNSRNNQKGYKEDKEMLENLCRVYEGKLKGFEEHLGKEYVQGRKKLAIKGYLSYLSAMQNSSSCTECEYSLSYPDGKKRDFKQYPIDKDFCSIDQERVLLIKEAILRERKAECEDFSPFDPDSLKQSKDETQKDIVFLESLLKQQV